MVLTVAAFGVPAGCLPHCTCERQLQALHADVWRLEVENAALNRELASMRWKEERCQAQLDELHGAYFSLQQCMGRQVQRVKVRGCVGGGAPLGCVSVTEWLLCLQVGRTKAERLEETTSGRSMYYRPLSRSASSQESSV